MALYRKQHLAMASKLILLALGYLTSAAALPEHICKHIAAGDYPKMNLKSVTYGGPKKLYIFVDNHVVYEVDVNEIKPDSVDLSAIKPTDWTQVELFAPGTKHFYSAIHYDTIDAVYCIQLSPTPGISSMLDIIRGVKHPGPPMMHVIMNKFEYMIDLRKATSAKKDRLSFARSITKTELHYEYAIVHDQPEDLQVTGYMLSRNIIAGTGDIVIYPLWWLPSMKITSYLSPSQKRTVYNLELTDKPSEVAFVLSNASKGEPLLESIPRGFIFKSKLYLIDDQLGCVYIIDPVDTRTQEKLVDLAGEPKKDLLFNRVNVPLEQFFCSSSDYLKSSSAQADASRCQTKIGSRKRKENFLATAAVMPSKLWIGLGVGFGVLVLIAVIGGIYYWTYYLNGSDKESTKWTKTKKSKSKSPKGKTSKTSKSSERKTPKTNLSKTASKTAKTVPAEAFASAAGKTSTGKSESQSSKDL